MGNAERERERCVCQLVAEQINREEGTDYRADLCRDDPPDVLLVSESGKHRTREAEVVSTPQDFTIRYDNKNTQKFERQLRAALSVLQVSGFDVLVGWRQHAVRFGMDLTVISELAKIIAATAPSDGHRHLRGVEIYKYSPEVARQVDYFRVRRCSSAMLAVHSSCLFWAPKDGSWVEEAVAKKAQTYDAALCARFLLVIDGLCHLDGEQMTAYRAAAPADRISFAEVWAVTMGRAYRLKP